MGAAEHRAGDRASSGSPVDTVVGISTDKACKPVNVMGMTKALQERILLEANLAVARARGSSCARYGNVLASRGSVIPLFHEQIEHGGPVTITTAGDDPLPAEPRRGRRHGLRGAARRPRRARPTSRACRRRAIVDVATALIGDREIEIEFIGIRPGREDARGPGLRGGGAADLRPRATTCAIQPILPELRPRRAEGEPFQGREYCSADDLVDLDGVRELLDAPRHAPGRSPQPAR